MAQMHTFLCPTRASGVPDLGGSGGAESPDLWPASGGSGASEGKGGQSTALDASAEGRVGQGTASSSGCAFQARTTPGGWGAMAALAVGWSAARRTSTKRRARPDPA